MIHDLSLHIIFPDILINIDKFKNFIAFGEHFFDICVYGEHDKMRHPFYNKRYSMMNI